MIMASESSNMLMTIINIVLYLRILTAVVIRRNFGNIYINVQKSIYWCTLPCRCKNAETVKMFINH